MRTLYFGGDLEEENSQQCVVIDVSPLLRELIEALSDENAISAADRPRRSALDDLALIEVARAERLELHVPMPEDARLRRICDAVLGHPEEARTLDDLAEEAGASARTLRRLFQQELGMSFAMWRQQVRLVEALALLGEGRPIATVSRDLGYTTPSAFTAMFKRIVGQAPSQLMRTPNSVRHKAFSERG
jgi:AraC-like DNA-binding protein